MGGEAQRRSHTADAERDFKQFSAIQTLDEFPVESPRLRQDHNPPPHRTDSSLLHLQISRGSNYLVLWLDVRTALARRHHRLGLSTNQSNRGEDFHRILWPA